MKKVRVQDAVGMVLCHDMTEIVPGRFKGRAFKKGHVVMEEDIEKLLDSKGRRRSQYFLRRTGRRENRA